MLGAKQHECHWLYNLTLPCVMLFWDCISALDVFFLIHPRKVSAANRCIEAAVDLHLVMKSKHCI